MTLKMNLMKKLRITGRTKQQQIWKHVIINPNHKLWVCPF